MKIKKNGVTIKLTENEIKKLRQKLLAEQYITTKYERDKRSDALKACFNSGGDNNPPVDSFNTNRWEGKPLPESCIKATQISFIPQRKKLSLQCIKELDIGSEGEPDNTIDKNGATSCIYDVYKEMRGSFDWI